MKNITLGDRMKRYEACTVPKLPLNTPVILRVDGRAFHSYTRDFEKPFDDEFITMMDAAGIALCSEMMNAKLAYIQSDEISVLMYPKIYSDVWFGNNVQKMCSIAASLASTCLTVSHMTYRKKEHEEHTPVITFDARVFAIPEKDVCNYFVWRQQDWERNSLNMLAQSYYTQEGLNGLNTAGLHDALHDMGVNWNDLNITKKRGRCIVYKSPDFVSMDEPDMELLRKNWVVDNEIPIFTKNRNYIEKYLEEVNADKIRPTEG